MSQELDALLNTSEGRRALAIASPSFFDTYYCGMRHAPHRARWLKRVDGLLKQEGRSSSSKVRMLQLAPRDHGKTEFAITIAARAICMNRNVRILWLSEGATASEKRLRRVKALLTSPKIVEDWTTSPEEGYGPWRDANGADKWSERIVQVSRTLALVDPTLEAVGSGGAITGGHFDIILCDDLEDNRTVYSAAERKKTRDWFFGTVGPMLSPGGLMLVIGTRKHEDDLYAHIEENPAWQMIQDDAILQWPESYEYTYSEDVKGRQIATGVVIKGFEGEVLWPQERSMEYLLLERLNAGTRLFAREWQHQVTDDSSAQIKHEWLVRAKERGRDLSLYQKPPVELAIVQGIDLALVTDLKKAEENDRDYTVVVTWGKAANGDRYLLGLKRVRGLSPGKLRQFIVEEFRRFSKVRNVRVERNAFGELHYMGLQKHTDLPLQPHLTTGQKKADPWDGVPCLAVLFENNKVIIPSKTEADRAAVEPLINELHGLGKERHDDCVMALWIAELGLRKGDFSYQVAFDDGDFDLVPSERRLTLIEGGRSGDEREVQARSAWAGLSQEYGFSLE